MKKSQFMLLMLWLLSLTTATAQPLPRDPQLRVGQLKNGLTYYIYPNQTPRGEAVYRLFVKSGSVNERDDQQGLAHFLEHLAFNGTKHFPGDGIVRFLESRGAKFGKDLNAHTSFNETVYKLQLPCTDPLLVDSTLTILADWACGLTIDPAEVEKERGVILSEWLSRGGTQTDNSMRLVRELLNGSIYDRRITIGDTAIIRHASPQTIRDYYKQWYRPELMALAVVGDIDVNQMEKMIREKFGALPAHPAKRVTAEVPVIPEYTSEAVTIATAPGVKTTELDMLMLLPQPPAVQTADDYRQYLERSLVNRLMKTRFAALSFDNPAYATGSVQYSRFLGATGVTDASVELTKGRLRKGIADFITHQQQIFRYGFTQSEIARAKKAVLSSMRNKVSNAGRNVRSISLMDEIYADYYEGNRFISRDEELRLMERFLPAIDSLSLLQLIQKTFESRPQHFLLRGGDEVKEEISDEDDLRLLIATYRQQPVDRYWHQVDVPDQLTSLEPADHIVSETPIPEIGATDLRLDNGARVIFRRSDTEHDRLTLSAFRKGGQYGIDSLHYFTGVVGPGIISLSGAGDFSREALSHYLTGNTASVRLLVDKLRTGVAGSAHLQDMETMFQLLWLRWMQPRLDTAVCRLTIDKLRENYLTKPDTPSGVFNRELGWIVGGRNYTNRVMTDEVIDREVKPADMLALHHRFYGPATGFTFVLMGDCDLEDVRPYISTYIGGLPAGKPDPTWVVSARQIPHRYTEFVSPTNDQQKATVTLTFQQDRPVGDLQRQEVYGSALKSVLRSALLKRLREDMGKVYSVSASVASGRYPSYLSRATIAFVCQPDDVDTLIGAVHDELRQLYDRPQHFAAYLDDVRQNLIKENALQRQQSSYWTSFIRNAVYNNDENWSWADNYESVVRAMTLDTLVAYAHHVLRDAYEVKAVLLPQDNTLSSPVSPRSSQAVANSSLLTLHSSLPTVSGTVFVDRNGNGLQDKGEKGLRDIPVTNGDTIVITDKQGRYELPLREGCSVFPILPADYTLASDRVVNAAFRYVGDNCQSSVVNYPLTKKPLNRRFRLNAIGDVQVSNHQELDYATRTLWPELLSSAAVPDASAKSSLSTINLFLGDLVNNNLSLYGDIRRLMEQLPQQSWTVLGNHDRDVDTVSWRQTRSYNETFGADMYAFNEGRCHFIVLNNVYPDGARGYKGRFSERQLRFVRQDLQLVPQDRLVVLCMHVPLAHSGNAAELISLVEGRGDVLVLSGHMHSVARFFHEGRGVRLHELSAGATCGFWWVGEKDIDGVPSALQQEGTPRNYFVLDFDDTRYQIRCKGVGLDADRQMTIHVTGIDTLDLHLRDLKDLPAGLMMMTVWGGCDSTEVRCRVDGGEWQVCQKQALIDPNVARARELNLQRIYPTKYNRLNPLRHRPSGQLWTLQLPADACRGAHVVEVEATDRFGFRATGRRSFCFAK